MRLATVAILLLLAPSFSGCFGSAPASEATPDRDVHERAFGPFPNVDLDAVEVTTTTVPSFDGTSLAVAVLRPPHATADTPVPVILHTPCATCGHWTSIEADGGLPARFLEAGFVVVSQQHRGQGDSEGTFPMHLPEIQGRDTLVVLDWIATLPFIAADGPGDPIVGMVGWSSGAMAQAITALHEIHTTGSTRLDALAIHSLPYRFNETLAPNGVPRSYWWDMISAYFPAMGVRLEPTFVEIAGHVAATGSLPDGSGGSPDGNEYLWHRSTASLVAAGARLDMPVLMSAAIGDTLFPLHEVIALHQGALSHEARNKSILAAPYPGGHRAMGMQEPPPSNACETVWGGAIWDLKVRFHRHHLLGEPIELGPPVQVATEQKCLLLPEIPGTMWFRLDGEAIVPAVGSTHATVEQSLFPVTEGPLDLAGVPRLNVTVSVAPIGARVFFALAAGPSPQEARILADQWMPLELRGGGDIEGLDLAGITGTVDAGEELYLVVARWVDQFGQHHDRLPGPVVLEGFEVALPVVDDEQVVPVDRAGVAAGLHRST